MFSLQQNWRRGQNRFCPEVGVESLGGLGGRSKVAQTMYKHVSKCKHNKIKKMDQNTKKFEE
jgi:hypothetical protein